MKILMKSIDMIAWFTQEGIPHPLKFRLEEQGSKYSTIKVSQIKERKKEKLAGNHMFVFTCQSIIQGAEKVYELKYEIATCRWFLYKI